MIENLINALIFAIYMDFSTNAISIIDEISEIEGLLKYDSVDSPVNDALNNIAKAFEEYKKANCGYAFSGRGDTFVAVFQTDEDEINDFLVVVSKDHYEYDFVNGE